MYPVPLLRYSASKNGMTLKLGIAPFDRTYTTFYWSAIVSTAPLSGTVVALVDVEKYRDLEIWVRGH